MPNFNKLANGTHRLRVLVVGDIMIDRYIHGSVSRISPEAPVPIMLRSNEATVLGGAGNVAANLRALGAQTSLIGVTGNDWGHDQTIKLCREQSIDTSGIVSVKHACTTIKTRFVSGSQQIVRVDEEQVLPLDDSSKQSLLRHFEREVSNSDIVILSDYNKGLFLADLAPQLIALAAKQDLRVIVDPKGTDYEKYKGATALTPNLGELSQAAGTSVATDNEVENAARGLINDLDLDHVLATRSERGMSVVSRSGAIHFPTKARQVYDVSGAGDTVISSYSVALASGFTTSDAAQFANAAAAVAVSKRGTAQVSLSEVLSELGSKTVSAASFAETLSWEEIESHVQSWRSRGLTIGFTNGCFDILHYGHISLLAQAKSHCDKLVVGLNSDASVRRLKGSDRPINAQKDRMALLAALRSIDAVVMFDQDTPYELIETIQPDILVKGGDYTIEDVVGRDIVENRGGKVVLIDLEEGRSTTGLISKINAKTNT